MSKGTPTSVLLVGTSELLNQRISWVLPGDVDLEHYWSLDEIGMPTKPLPAVTLYKTERIDEGERRRIEGFLRKGAVRLVIFCDKADPSEIYRLAVSGAPLGLVAIESDISLHHLEACMKTWFWGGLIRPDWSALGAAEEEPPYHVGRMMKVIERDPFSDFRVRELAHYLRISDRTLNRAVQCYFGRSVKSLLMALRYQLMERVRDLGYQSAEDLAALFGFASVKDFCEWRRGYNRRHLTPSA